MRLDVRNKKRVAICLGFGPRFLRSTGQAYKGGLPGQKFTFGTVKAAQARSDFDVLAERQRRALRVHLPADLKMGLATLEAAITEALK
jgi:transaldolase / glucose-6-phosphate isomerase